MAKEYYSLEVRSCVAGFPMANAFVLAIDNPSVANEFEVAGSIIEALNVGAGPTAWLFRYRALMSDEAYISNILCRRMTDGGGNTAEAVLQQDSLPGLAAGQVAGTQVAALAIWTQTAVATKTGRNFIPGVSVADISNGRFTADFQTRFSNFIARHLAGFNVSAGTAFFQVWNRAGAIGYDVANGYLSIKTGTQRRRERPL